MASVILHEHDEASELPLVLLAPFPCDARVWDGVVDWLGGDVLTMDPPGFGGEVDDDPSIEGYADAVLAALDARGVGSFVVAGNSMGGYVAMRLAEIAEDRVAGIGLLGTKASADGPDARAGRLRMADRADAGEPVGELLAPMKAGLVGASSLERDPGLAARLDDLTDASASGVAWAQRAMAARPDRLGVLRMLGDDGVPGLVLVGDEDSFMSDADQSAMADALGSSVVRVNAGHLVELERPVEVGRALRDLWARSGR